MPSSSYAGTLELALYLDGYDNRIRFGENDTVLDIGCGIGRIGMMIREMTDYKAGRFKREEFKTNLIGVDIWAPYLQEVQKAIYSKLVVSEALDFLAAFQSAGKTSKLTILSHILEHMNHDHGENVLNICRQVSDWTIVMLPLVDSPQEPIFGNPHEAHISEWTLNELARMSAIFDVAGKGIYPNGVFLIPKKEAM